MRSPCGTNAAYNNHVRNRETPCDPCRKAHAAYRAAYRKRVYLNKRGSTMVPAIGVHRRIRALMRMGWRCSDIAAIARPDLKSADRWVQVLLDVEYVHEATFRVISAAYEQLSARPGPSQQNRTLALNRGWPPPMAWDDIDDPDCKPQGYLRPCDLRKRKDKTA